jgi:hypothetical protein
MMTEPQGAASAASAAAGNPDSPAKKSLLLRLFNRAMIFFLIMAAITAILYGIGIYRQFADLTQLLLLRLTALFSLLLVLSSVYGLFPVLWRMIHRNGLRYLPFIILKLALAALGALLCFGSVFILTVTGGNS